MNQLPESWGALLRQVADGIPAMIWMSDAENRGTYFNRPWLAFTGRTLDQELGHAWAEGVHPDDRAGAVAFCQSAFDRRQAFEMEFRLRRADGEYRWLLDCAVPRHGPDGEFLGYVGCCIDITERRRAEQALEASQEALQRERELLQTVFDRIPVMIALYEPGTQVTRLNREFERTVGWSTEAARGVDLMARCYPDPAYREEVRAYMTSLREGWRDIRMQTRDGRVIETSWANIRLSDHTQVGIGIEIGERKRAEEALRERERELSALRDRLTAELAAMTRLHEIGTRFVREGNPAVLLQQVLDAVAAITGTDLGSIQLLDPVAGVLEIVVHRGFEADFLAAFGRVRPGEAACGRALAEGRRLVVEDVDADPRLTAEVGAALRRAGVRAVQSTPIFTRSGEVLGVVSTHFRRPHRPSDAQLRLVDLFARQAGDLIEHSRTQRVREQLLAQERAHRTEAEAASRAKDEFLAMLGHELRNPLGAMASAAHVLDVIGGSRPEAVRARAIFKRQLRHLSGLVDDLLDVGRVTTGKIALARRRLRLADVVRHSTATLAAGGRPAHVLTETLDDDVWVDADEQRLEQVVGNLLSNAVKYTAPGGRIAVAVRADGARALLEVADSGIGIRAEMLPRVFDLFVQGEQDLQRSRGGLGVGLTLARRLVELHGGTVTASSDGPGRGSVFAVALPRAEPPPPPGRAAGAATDGCRRLVLVVEDNDDAREMLRTVLELAGHAVVETADGPDAVAAVEFHKPDVALIDIGLPGLDGYEVARRIRASGAGRQVRLVALTGYGQPEDRRRSAEAGFEEHLVKPIDPGALARVLAGPRAS